MVEPAPGAIRQPHQMNRSLGKCGIILWINIYAPWYWRLARPHPDPGPPAQALYQRLGFKPYKQERKTILDPRIAPHITSRA